MQPSAFEKRFSMLWDGLEKWNKNSGPRRLGAAWKVGEYAHYESRTNPATGEKTRDLVDKRDVTAHIETCGISGQMRLVMVGKNLLHNRDKAKVILWSARVIKDGQVWIIVTPEAKGWTRYNRFVSAEQIAEQRLIHLNTGLRLNGLKTPPETHKQARLPLSAAMLMMPALMMLVHLLNVLNVGDML